MTVKHFVASAFALLLLLSTAGTAVAGHAALLCPASHAKLDAALHDRFHAAPGGSRVQAIVRRERPCGSTRSQAWSHSSGANSTHSIRDYQR